MPESSESPATTAAYPFNQSSADLILRSSDGVDFHVHRIILSQASPVFADMFTLPQPASDADTPNPSPLCIVSEDAQTLETILHLCYPIPKRNLRRLGAVVLALEAAIKYEMEWPISLLTKDLLSVAAQNPLMAWAVACRTGREEIVRSSASIVSSKGMSGLENMLQKEGLQILDGITAGDYFRLRNLTVLARYAANPKPSPIVLLSGISDHFASDVPPSTSMPVPSDLLARDFSTAGNAASPPLVHIIEVDAVPSFPTRDVVLVSTDGAHIYAHQLVLSLHSPTLATLLAPAAQAVESPLTVSPLVTTPRLLELDAHSETLCTLIKMCYAGEELVPSDPSKLASVLVVSEKYQMARVSAAVERRWEQVANQHPLEMYVTAIKYGLSHTTIAKSTARKTLKVNLAEQYVHGLEDIPALPYHRLLVYHKDCVKAVNTQLKKGTLDWCTPKRGYRTFDRPDGSWLDSYLLSMVAESILTPGQEWPVTTAAIFNPACSKGPFTSSLTWGLKWSSECIHAISELGTTFPEAIKQAIGEIELET